MPEEQQQIQEQTILTPPRKIDTPQEQQVQQSPVQQSSQQQNEKLILETYTGQQRIGNQVSSFRPQVSSPPSQIQEQKEEIPLASLRKRAMVEKLFEKQELKNKPVRESPQLEPLKKFINNSIKLGYRPREIARALIDKGWQLSDIQKSFEELKITM